MRLTSDEDNVLLFRDPFLVDEVLVRNTAH